MTATETVAKWQHLDAALSDSTWPTDIFASAMLREFWQAAKLGAAAEAALTETRAENTRLKEQLLRWARSASRATP